MTEAHEQHQLSQAPTPTSGWALGWEMLLPLPVAKPGQTKRGNPYQLGPQYSASKKQEEGEERAS